MAPPGRRRASLSPATALLGLVFLFSSTASAASAVLGVDLGTEYIKAALVKPGIPLEIVLTKDSKRKETSAVAFKPSKSGALDAGSYPERFYGGDAIALQARFPGDVYPNLKHLLGVASEDDVVSVYAGRYPALDIKATDGRKTVSFTSGIFAAEAERSFSVEELLAMELKNVRENAKSLAGKGYDVQDVVFTIPPFYTVEEKRALEVAAHLAGLKVLSVVTDGLAVGINYATSRTFPTINEGGKPEINLVFDMGAGSASATVLKFQGRTVKDVGKRNKTVQEVQVLGAGWDRTLGGDALNSLIVDSMVSSFVDLPSAKSASITAEKVKNHGRTAAKLFKEAEKVRQVLSANSATAAFFESFFEDIDFRYKLSRTEYEALATEYAARVEGPINQALEAAGLTFADIDSVIVHGGATRTPFVQSRLEAIAGKAKIRANVNSDEAAVFGAAFKAAGLSPSFRVKEIRDSDAQGYSHGIQYTHNLKERDQKIFSPSSKLGATKDLPFQMMGEFEFKVYQSVPGVKGDASKEPTLQFKSGNLTQTVAKMIETDGCDRASFNNYVQVRLSPTTGVPEITSAWVTCEAEVEPKGGIVDGVKNLFGMGGKKDQEALKDGESTSESASSSTKSKSKSKKSASSSSSSVEAESTDAAKAGEKKKKTIKSAITYDVKQLGYEKHPRKEIKRMQDRLAAFDASDKSRRVREEALNSLEAFTYRARDYLEDEAFISASVDAVRTTLEEKLNAASDWIYSDGPNASEKDLKAKLKELEDIINPVLRRKREFYKRPAAIQELQETINHMKEVKQLVDSQIKEQVAASSKSSEAVAKASASPSPSSSSKDSLDDLEEDTEVVDPEPTEIAEVVTVYTEADLKSIEDLTAKAQKWLDDSQEKQKNVEPTEDPVLTVEDLIAEKKKLDDVVMEMMMKRMKAFKPPKPKATPKSKSKSKKKTPKPTSESKPAEAEEPKPTAEGKSETEAEVKTPVKEKTETDEKPGSQHPHPDSQAQMEEMEQGHIDHRVLGGGDGPSEEEVKEALRKAGIYQDSDWEKQGPKHNEL